MTTVYTLLPVVGDDDSLPSIDIAEQSMMYEITAWNDSAEATSFGNLTAREVLAIAHRMIQVVLYQHPELIDEARAGVQHQITAEKAPRTG